MLRKEYVSENKNLTIYLEETDDFVKLEWVGKCTLLYPAPFLNPIFEEAASLNKKIVINFTKLDYITSSGLSPVIMILDHIKHGSGVIEIQFDNNSEWQEMHFSALRIFCTPDKRIQVNAI